MMYAQLNNIQIHPGHGENAEQPLDQYNNAIIQPSNSRNKRQ